MSSYKPRELFDTLRASRWWFVQNASKTRGLEEASPGTNGDKSGEGRQAPRCAELFCVVMLLAEIRGVLTFRDGFSYTASTGAQ